MQACSFDESNHVLGAPEGMSPDECDALSVFLGEDTLRRPVVVSCWKLEKGELELINRTGRVWLIVIGPSMPPVALMVQSPMQRNEQNGQT